jgi:hypothetical protein
VTGVEGEERAMPSTEDSEEYMFCRKCKKYYYESKGHICPQEAPVAHMFSEEEKRIVAAVGLAGEYGDIDGGHHKMWVIDQMCRILLGDTYDAWVKCIKSGEDGPDTYGWDEGIAP